MTWRNTVPGCFGRNKRGGLRFNPHTDRASHRARIAHSSTPASLARDFRRLRGGDGRQAQLGRIFVQCFDPSKIVVGRIERIKAHREVHLDQIVPVQNECKAPDLHAWSVPPAQYLTLIQWLADENSMRR